MYGNCIRLPVLTGWTACVCVSVCGGAAGEPDSCWTIWSGSWSPGCWETELNWKEVFFWKKMCYFVNWYLQPSDVLVCSLLRDSETRRARWWSVWNNSCWLLFLNFLCFVESFKAIPDWSWSRLLLKVGIMSFLVYWIAAWGNNSDGIRCHNPSGSLTGWLETLQSRFHHRDQQWPDENL